MGKSTSELKGSKLDDYFELESLYPLISERNTCIQKCDIRQVETNKKFCLEYDSFSEDEYLFTITEELCQSAHDNISDLFDSLTDLLFVLDEKGDIQKINKQVELALAYTEKELKGKSVYVVHPKSRKTEAEEIVSQILKGERESCPIPLISKYGNEIPVETKVKHGIWNGKPAIYGMSRSLLEERLNEEKFTKVFNSGSALMIISTIEDGKIIEINDAFLQLLSYEREEVVGKTSKELNIYKDYSERLRWKEEFVREGQLKKIELEILSKNKKLYTCLFTFQILKIKGTSYVLSSGIDISELKRRQRELVDIMSLNQKILSESPIGIGMYNIKGDCLQLNNAMARMAGGPLEEMKTKNFNSLESWKKAGLLDAVKDTFDSQKNRLIEIEAQSFYGRHLFAECTLVPFDYKKQKHILLLVSNITERKNAELELEEKRNKIKESEYRLAMALESANEGLWDWNVLTGHVFFSDTWCTMLGYEPHEIEMNVSSWEKLVHPDDMGNVMEVLQKHLDGESDYYETVHRVKAKSGEWKWILDHGRVVERAVDNSPVRAIGTHIDISKQKETEENLQALINTKDKFFSIIAHDLKSPMGSFLQVLELLTRRKNLPEEQRLLFLEELQSFSANTYQLLENLLHWLKSQYGNINARKVLLPLNELVKENIDFLQERAKSKEIELLFPEQELFLVEADKDMLNLVFRNLITNAIKFTNTGGFVKVELEDRLNEVIVRVIDNGVGFNQKDFDAIFLQNNFLWKQGTSGEKGHGLGLLLCKEFIEKHSGMIWLDSTYGVETRICFSIAKVQ